MKQQHSGNNYQHILKYVGLFGGVQGLAMFIGLLRNKLIALLLGPQGMGIISLFNSTTKLIGDSINLGLGISAVRELSEKYVQGNEKEIRYQVDVIRSWSLLTALLGMLVCLMLSPWLNDWVFQGEGRTFNFVLLSVVVGMLAVASGELAILKAVRHLSKLAKVSIYQIIGALITSVPLCYLWGETAIVPTIIINAMLQLGLIVYYSHRIFALRFALKQQLLIDGFSLIKLGMAFAMAGVLGSGAEFLIRTYLHSRGNAELVGLYNAGYVIAFTYGSIVFSSLESDYFPRLSGMKQLGEAFNQTINRQIEISLLMIIPLIVLMLTASPVLLPLLYSKNFMAVLPMMQIAVLSLLFRALYLPVEYIPLARGDSKSYLLLEGSYNIFIVLFIYVCYGAFGLKGTGIAITLTAIVNYSIVLVYTYYKYSYKVSRSVIYLMIWMLPLVGVTYILTCLEYNTSYWLLSALILGITCFICLQQLNKRTDAVKALSVKFKRKQ